MKRPEYLLECSDMLATHGAEALGRALAPAVLVGLGLLGRATVHAVTSARRTFGAYDLEELQAVQHVLDRVWPIVKAPSAPPGRYVTIGQAHDNDIVIHEHTLSSRHAAFRLYESRIWVADLGSLNGTKLDGELLERRKLFAPRDGSKLSLGRLHVQFFSAAGLVERLGSRG